MTPQPDTQPDFDYVAMIERLIVARDEAQRRAEQAEAELERLRKYWHGPSRSAVDNQDRD